MNSNKIISLVTIILSFILFIALKPGDDPVLMFRVASITATIVFVGTILYTHVLWRVSPFNKLHKVIDIGGKWEGKIKMEDGSILIISAIIKQHLANIRINIQTNDHYTDSLACYMATDYQGTKLYATYKSRPNGKVDSKEQIEYGTLIINCDEDFLEGLFFGSNKQVGKIELYRK